VFVVAVDAASNIGLVETVSFKTSPCNKDHTIDVLGSMFKVVAGTYKVRGRGREGG
jgi:hypothetical protein